MANQKKLIGGGINLRLFASLLDGEYSHNYKTELKYISEDTIMLNISTRYSYLALGGQLVRATIELQRDQDDIMYKIGHGQWLDKIIIGGCVLMHVGAGIFLPLAIMGAVKQFTFFSDIEKVIIAQHLSVISS